MSAATKVTIAIVVLFAAVLGVYYGFSRPDAGALPAEPVAEAVEPVPLEETQPPGYLSSSVDDAIREDDVLAMDIGPLVAQPPPAEPLGAPAVVTMGPPPGYVDYTVQESDSLWTIAEDRLGDSNRWGEIAAANPSLDPNRLRVGQPSAADFPYCRAVVGLLCINQVGVCY